jgi:hypothetical protein
LSNSRPRFGRSYVTPLAIGELQGFPALSKQFGEHAPDGIDREGHVFPARFSADNADAHRSPAAPSATAKKRSSFRIDCGDDAISESVVVRIGRAHSRIAETDQSLIEGRKMDKLGSGQ